MAKATFRFILTLMKKTAYILFCLCKMSSIFLLLENKINFFNWKTTSMFLYMKDNLIFSYSPLVKTALVKTWQVSFINIFSHLMVTEVLWTKQRPEWCQAVYNCTVKLCKELHGKTIFLTKKGVPVCNSIYTIFLFSHRRSDLGNSPEKNVRDKN